MGRDSDNGHDDRSMTKGEWKTQESKDGDIKATYTEGKAAATAGEGYTIAEAEDGGRAVAVSGDREKISKEMADGGKHRAGRVGERPAFPGPYLLGDDQTLNDESGFLGAQVS